MRTAIFLTIVQLIFTSVNAQTYFSKGKTPLFNQSAFDSISQAIDKSISIEELPEKIQFIIPVTISSYLIKDDTWYNAGAICPPMIVRGSILESSTIPHDNRSAGEFYMPKLDNGRYSNKFNTNYLVIKLDDNLFIKWSDVMSLGVQMNLKTYRVNKKHGSVVKEFKQEWKKGFELLDLWVNKATTIRVSERELKTQQEEVERLRNDSLKQIINIAFAKKVKRQKAVRDSLQQAQRLEVIRKNQAKADSIRKVQAAKEAIRKQNNIKKFGQTNGTLINEGKVRIGFTKEMCIAAWGKPQDVNKTIDQMGTIEQWVYNLYDYLYFKNGKLATIQTSN